MRIKIAGEENGSEKKYEYNLLDKTDESGTLSMARTTGYTCTAAVQLVAKGKFNRKGICPPEYLGEDECNFHFIMAHLLQRKVQYHVAGA